MIFRTGRESIARNQYQAGLIEFQNVLEAQRSLLSFQDLLVQSRAAVTANLVRTYKAPGGGWEAIPCSGRADFYMKL